MGVNKDTKIFYKHGDADDFDGVAGQSTTGTITWNNAPTHEEGTVGWKEADSFTYRNEANDADIVKNKWQDVLADLITKHTVGSKSAYPEGVVPMKTWASVAEAKAGMFGQGILAGFDTHCDRQEWALVDGNKGLKHTRDWKIENDASADGHYAQFKTTFDSRHSNAANPYLQLGAIITTDNDHLF